MDAKPADVDPIVAFLDKFDEDSDAYVSIIAWALTTVEEDDVGIDASVLDLVWSFLNDDFIRLWAEVPYRGRGSRLPALLDALVTSYGPARAITLAGVLARVLLAAENTRQEVPTSIVELVHDCRWAVLRWLTVCETSQK